MIKSNNIFLNASEHLFLLSSSETLMLRNYSRFKKFNYCSQIGGSESIRDIQEAKNIDADAFEFQIVESLFSVTKIIQAFQKIYSDSIEELSSKFIFINITSSESLTLLKDLKDFQFPKFLNKNNFVINYDRRALIRSLFKTKNNNFEVSNYEQKLNEMIHESIKENIKNNFLISLSGGINYDGLKNFFNEDISLDFVKTGLFTIKYLKEDQLNLKNDLLFYQSLEAKLLNIMSNSISNKTQYLKERKIHLTDYLLETLN